MEEKIDKFGYIKVKNYCLPETNYESHHKESETISTNWEEDCHVCKRMKINIQNAERIPTTKLFLRDGQ